MTIKKTLPERTWLRKRGLQIDGHMPSKRRSYKDVLANARGPALSDTQEKLETPLEALEMYNRAQAYRDGCLLRSEATGDVKMLAEIITTKHQKADAAALKVHGKNKAQLAGKASKATQLIDPTLQVCLDADLREDRELHQFCLAHGVHDVANDRTCDASIFLCSALSSATFALRFAAVLFGGVLSTRGAYMEASGDVAVFFPAITTPRRIFVSAAVRKDHAWLVALLAQCARKSKWTIISKAMFIDRTMREMAKQLRQRAVQNQCAIVAANEKDNDALWHSLPNAYSPEAFFQFLRRQDVTRSTLGVCGM